jgi:hypothetical protein
MHDFENSSGVIVWLLGSALIASCFVGAAPLLGAFLALFFLFGRRR